MGGWPGGTDSENRANLSSNSTSTGTGTELGKIVNNNVPIFDPMSPNVQIYFPPDPQTGDDLKIIYLCKSVHIF